MTGVPAALGAEALFAALCLVPGLPLAFALDGRRATPLPALLVDGLGLGLAWLAVVAVALIRVQHLDRRALAATALFTGFAGWRVARLRGVPLARPVRPRLATWAPAAAILLVAGAVRADPSNFLFMVGDMGEYVNDANMAARGVKLVGSFPHGFSALLAVSSVLRGTGGTVDVLPFAGLVLVAVLLGVGRELRGRPAATLVVAACVAVGVAPVWFSRFPVSESLYATLLAVALYLLLAAHRRDSLALAVAGGLLLLPCGLTRGNVLLVAVPIALYGLVRAASGGRGARLDVAFVLAAAVGSGAATLYLLRFNEVYMLAVLPDNLGSSYGVLERNGFLAFGARAVVAVLAVCLMLALALAGVARVAALRRPATAALRVAPVTVAVLAVLAVVATGRAGGLYDAGGRYGVLLLACGALGLVAPLLAGADGPRGVLLLVAGIGAAGALLFAKRVPHVIDHSFFLYPDRYLFSEGFVATALLAVAGADVALCLAARRRAGAAAAAVAAAAGVAALVPATRLAGRHAELAGGYEQAAELARLTHGAPVIWSGVAPAERAPFFFPNTFRAYALPLFMTFHEPVLNIGSLQPFGPDPRLDPVQAIAIAAPRTRVAFLVRERPRGPGPLPPDGAAGPWTWRRTGTSRGTVWQLPKRRTSGERWRPSVLVFDVYELIRQP